MERSDTRTILRLAVPALLSLVAEPLFLLADSAIVGHLGVAPLAGLGVASAALLTAANVFVFLAYGTTSLVARWVGAGRQGDALGAGVDGMWLAIGVGVVTALLVALFATPVCRVFGAGGEVLAQAAVYLRISALGLPAMLLALAATGVLRGFQNTVTPLVATTVGFAANLALNLVLVYGVHLGIAGSAYGTVIAQWGMATGLAAVVLRRATAEGASLVPRPNGVLRSARHGVPLLVRTVALRAVLLLTTWDATALGDIPLAAHQVAMTVFGFLSFVLDALAIAAQSLTGTALGAGDTALVRSRTRLMLGWSLGAGCAVGVLLGLIHTVLPPVFTPDAGVRSALAAALVVIALLAPVAGVVFVLDGVLIGAGDGRALAVVQTVLLLLYAPVAIVLHAHAADLARHGARTSVVALWCAFATYMIARMALLLLRSRSDRWLVPGA
ncbi:MATE family efflux transporter [Allobranchiibius sp. GilTou73]|uniref:MATE family efflux transporter n=1 Tax=Allobranchiibius sp. GilTou73 TaxID=2904523 RepID=UPI001F392C6B|nr:MATE family efflux transporter [Allobranchiibius sp. GilTou73]UIJ35636.1 MATE family efflux transporter [Allobranchiibius sp. GilTou73]